MPTRPSTNHGFHKINMGCQDGSAGKVHATICKDLYSIPGIYMGEKSQAWWCAIVIQFKCWEGRDRLASLAEAASPMTQGPWKEWWQLLKDNIPHWHVLYTHVHLHTQTQSKPPDFSNTGTHLRQEAHYHCLDFSSFISILSHPHSVTMDVKIFKLAINTVNTASRGTGTPCPPWTDD